jgi:crotonobetainyl-CoA hydratase
VTEAEGVRVEQRGAVLVVTLDRPPANAIAAATSRALHRAFRLLASSADLRSAVLTGAGSRFFSAGWDLTAASDGEPADADHGPGGFAGLTEMWELDKPVIAAVNGPAYGGGVELMRAAHLVVASSDAVFAFPEATLGVVADAGGLVRLPRRLPRAVAVELLLTGSRFRADDALRWGLVNRVVPPEEVLQASLDLAEKVGRSAPLSVAATLRGVRLADGLGEADAFAALKADRLVQGVPTSSDAAEGVAAFVERREPRWSGS